MRLLTVCSLALFGLLMTMSPATAQTVDQPPVKAQAQTGGQPAAQPQKATINLNAAPIDQLETLPGVGRKMAERIVEYRQKSGGFKKIEELMNVKGIGEKNFLRLKPFVFVPARTDKAGQ